MRLGEPDWTWRELLASDLASSVNQPRAGAVESIELLGRAGGDGTMAEADRAFVTAIDTQIARTTNSQVIVCPPG